MIYVLKGEFRCEKIILNNNVKIASSMSDGERITVYYSLTTESSAIKLSSVAEESLFITAEQNNQSLYKNNDDVENDINNVKRMQNNDKSNSLAINTILSSSSCDNLTSSSADNKRMIIVDKDNKLQLLTPWIFFDLEDAKKFFSNNLINSRKPSGSSYIILAKDLITATNFLIDRKEYFIIEYEKFIKDYVNIMEKIPCNFYEVINLHIHNYYIYSR